MEVSQEIEDLIKKVNGKTELFEQSNVVGSYMVSLSDNINKVSKENMGPEYAEVFNREFDLMKKLRKDLYIRHTQLSGKKAIVGMAGNIQSKFQPSAKKLKAAIADFINESQNRVKNDLLKILSEKKQNQQNQSQQPEQPEQTQSQQTQQQPTQPQQSQSQQTQSQPTQPQQSQPQQSQPQQSQPQQSQPQQSQPQQTQQQARPQQTQSQPQQTQQQAEPEQQEDEIDMKFENAVMDNCQKKIKFMEDLQKKNSYRYGEKPKYEEFKEFFENNKDVLSESEIEGIERRIEECLNNPNDLDLRNELSEELKGVMEEAQSRKTIEAHNVGFGDVCYASDTERSKGHWEMYTNYTKGEGKAEFVTKKNSGSKTSYDMYDKQTNCAQIIFDKPVKVGEASGIFFFKDGSKGCLGISDQKEVTAANVKLNNGVIDFSLPENSRLLQHPEVVAQIVKLYPDSLKSVPVSIYATDPKLFASMYAEGVKEALKNPAVLGTMDKEEYISEKMKALQIKTAVIQQNKGFDHVKDAAQTVQKDFNAQMSQMGG